MKKMLPEILKHKDIGIYLKEKIKEEFNSKEFPLFYQIYRS